MPELFEVIRVLADDAAGKKKFLLLGSASFRLIHSISESLAGRAGFVDMTGFTLEEIGGEHNRRLWTRGSFPRSYLANDESASNVWRDSFIRTFLERDIPQLGITVPAEAIRRFWTMIAHYHGQVWNAAEFARSLGQGEKSARAYLDILTGSFMVRQLQPWYENMKKRQVKSPKVYVRDSGLLHKLMFVEDMKALQSHPKLGASWEGFCLEQVINVLGADRQAWFWATHSGAELDLLIIQNNRRIGFEFKYNDAPVMTRSLQSAIDCLRLDRVWIVYPGDKDYILNDKVAVVSILNLTRAATL